MPEQDFMTTKERLDNVGFCEGVCPARGLSEKGKLAVAETCQDVIDGQPAAPPTYDELQRRFPELLNVDVGAANFCLRQCLLRKTRLADSDPVQ